MPCLKSEYSPLKVLWLFGPDHEVTEVGAMNVFAFLEDKSTGKRELVTPPLDKGIILPGVTRRSIVELTSEWDEFEGSERKLTMPELIWAALPQSKSNVTESMSVATDMFGGTAWVRTAFCAGPTMGFPGL